MKVLTVEDDRDMAEVVEMCFSVRWPDAEVFNTVTGSEVPSLVAAHAPDIVILDLGLPDVSGLEVVRRIREFSSVPVIILTDQGDEASRVRGLEGGADDFVVKPFSHLELLARVRAVLRRANAASSQGIESTVSAGGLTINPAARRLTVEGQVVELTRTEWNLLLYLLRNEGRVASHRALAERVWGSEYVDSTVIKAAVRRLRLKLRDDGMSPKLVRSHRGLGYSLTLDR